MRRYGSLRKWVATVAAGGAVLQITACLGPDPQFFLASSVANAAVSSVVGALVNLLLGSAA